MKQAPSSVYTNPPCVTIISKRKLTWHHQRSSGVASARVHAVSSACAEPTAQAGGDVPPVGRLTHRPRAHQYARFLQRRREERRCRRTGGARSECGCVIVHIWISRFLWTSLNHGNLRWLITMVTGTEMQRGLIYISKNIIEFLIDYFLNTF